MNLLGQSLHLSHPDYANEERADVSCVRKVKVCFEVYKNLAEAT